MQKYADVVLDRHGNVVPSAEVRVKTSAGIDATLYSDVNGAPANNPIITDSLGRFSFYALNGRYNLEVYLGSALLTTTSDILLEDPMDETPEAIKGGSIKNTALEDITIDGKAPGFKEDTDALDVRVTNLEEGAGATGRWCGAFATAPTTRLNGDPLQDGDEYQNTTTNLRYTWSGGLWVALNSITKNFPFSFVAGQAQYDVFVISGDAGITTAGLVLWVEGAIEYDFTINDTTKFTLNDITPYADGAQMRIVVNANFDDVVSNLADLEASFIASEAEREAEFQEFLNNSGMEVAIPYMPGLVLTRTTQVVSYMGDNYRVQANYLPLTTTNWATDSPKMQLVDDLKDHLPKIVDYYGADPLGVNDSTAALLLAGPGSYLSPGGKYFADTKVINVTWFHGQGEIYGHNGQVIRVDNNPIAENYKQRRVMEPNFGGHLTPIYPSATNAPQGLARFRHPVTGLEYFFISQLISGQSWSATERSRTSMWAVRDDGLPQNVIDFTPAMKVTHAHLSVLYENDQIWMYQSFVPPDDAIDNSKETGCGWSKYPWKGSANVDSDVINYRVWGRPGSGHRYENYGKACVQASQDGRFMIMIGINYSGNAGGRTLFVYDRLEVESAADPLDCEPIYMSQTLRGVDVDADTAYQGESSDGRFLYNVWGASSVFGRRGIVISTLNGDKLREIDLDGAGGYYTNDQLRNGHPTLGICVSSEPEGLALWGDKMYVAFTDNWAAIGDVVPCNGNNYVCLTTNNTGVNNQPDMNTITWRITGLAANKPEWTSAGTYSVGATTQRKKWIMEVTPAKGRPDERPLVSTYRYPDSIAPFPVGISELVSMSIPHGGYWRLSTHVPSTDSYRIAMEYLINRIRFRDVRNGADNSKYASLERSSMSDADVLRIYASNNSATDGASLSLYGNADPTVPGELRLSSGSSTATVRIQCGGVTKFNATELDIALYVAPRPITDAAIDNGSITRTWLTTRTQDLALGVSTCTQSSGIVSPEGFKVAGPSSKFYNRATGKEWRKATGTGNTGWVELA